MLLLEREKERTILVCVDIARKIFARVRLLVVVLVLVGNHECFVYLLGLRYSSSSSALPALAISPCCAGFCDTTCRVSCNRLRGGTLSWNPECSSL